MEMTMPLQKTFADNMRQMLAEKRMTQSDLAARMKVQPSYISHLLTGYRTPHLDTLERIAKAFGCDPSELIREKVN